MDNENYAVFIASDSQNSAYGFITLNEGSSIYAGGKFGVILELYVIEKNVIPVLVKHFLIVLLNLLEAKAGNAWK